MELFCVMSSLSLGSSLWGVRASAADVGQPHILKTHLSVSLIGQSRIRSQPGVVTGEEIQSEERNVGAGRALGPVCHAVAPAAVARNVCYRGSS